MANGSNDPLVVRTEELASVLREWIHKHSARFPTNLGPGHSEGFSPYYYLVENSSYPISERNVWRILNCESLHTNFAIADSILSATDQTHALHDGRVNVIPNPKWSTRRWTAWKEEQECF